MASLMILVKSSAWSAKPMVEKENGTENKLKKIYCTSKYIVIKIVHIKQIILLIFLSNALVKVVSKKGMGSVKMIK